MPYGWWFCPCVRLAASQESFLKMKGHLLKGPLHFLVGACHGLHVRWAPDNSSSTGPVSERPGWSCLPCTRASCRAPAHFGPHSKLAAIGWLPRKSQYMTPKSGNILPHLRSKEASTHYAWKFSFKTLWMNVSLPHINYKLSIFNIKVLKCQSATLL